MQSPSPILLMLPFEQICFDLRRIRWWYWSVRYVPGDDESWKEKEGTTIFTRPITRWQLQMRKEGETVVYRL